MRRVAYKTRERPVASVDDCSPQGHRLQPRAKNGVLRGVVLCVIFIFIFASNVPAQNISRHKTSSISSYFLGGSLLSNRSSADIPALDGSALCGTFQHGGKDAFGGFLGATFPLSGTFSLAPELEYNSLPTSMTINAIQTNQMPEILAPDGSSYVAVDRTRTYAVALSMATIAGMASYSPFAALHLSAGPFVGILLQHSFLETEHIVSPNSAVYAENSLQTRTIGSGQLPGLHVFQLGLMLRAGYEFPVEPNIDISPSIGWMIPLTAISSGNLQLYTARASLELIYHVPESPQPTTPVPIPIPEHAVAASPSRLVPKRDAMKITIKALGVGENGEPVSEPALSIERVHVTEVYPMLHYVFFNDGSASIPVRYDRSTAQTRALFKEKSLFKDNALEIHHHLLDIIGRRLMEDSSASITLVGARSEHSPGDSASGSSIAMARARAVQDYLVTVWGISRDRLHLQARDLPESASDDHNPAGEAENRRVDIIPSSATITAPLWTEHIERVATPPRIDFIPTIITEPGVGIRSATIMVMQHGRLLRTIDAFADSSTSQYQWDIDDHSMPEGSPGREDSLFYIFTAVDSLGDTARARGVLRLHEQASDISKHASDTVGEKQIERYSLILFGYSSSLLDRAESERMVADMATNIASETQITLTGYTDETGDDAFNDDLSRARAVQASELLRAELKHLGKSEPSIVVTWRGDRDKLFDNSFPEGRMLSRTVRATLENP